MIIRISLLRRPTTSCSGTIADLPLRHLTSLTEVLRHPALLVRHIQAIASTPPTGKFKRPAVTATATAMATATNLAGWVNEGQETKRRTVTMSGIKKLYRVPWQDKCIAKKWLLSPSTIMLDQK